MAVKRLYWGPALLALLLGGGILCGAAEKTDEISERGIRLRVLEGLKEGATEPARVVTSSFLSYMLSATFPSDAEPADEEKQLKKIFGLADVKLLTEADLDLKPGQLAKTSHVFRIDGKEYVISLTARGMDPRSGDENAHRFWIEILEKTGPQKVSLLESEFGFPSFKNVAVFGFEDTQGKPYFISLRETRVYLAGGVVGGVEGGVEGGVAGGVSGGVTGAVEGGVSGGVEGGVEKGAVRCVGEIKPPRLLKRVEPAYPKAALEARVQGVVVLETKTDVSGRVTAAKVLRSVPLLDQAAIDSVKRWVYEPLIVGGKAREAIFTVTVRFQLDEKAAEVDEFALGAVKVKDEIAPPRLLKLVEPIYPEIARQARVEGIVILRARIGTDGRVQKVMVLKSIPLLDQAAVDAVRQWVYEPLMVGGELREAVFTVTVRFEPKTKDKAGSVSSTDEVSPPKLIKRVDPVYPEEARKAGIQGMVILEAMTDDRGNVVRVRVLSSIPELDKAAIDALKQWKYEPPIINGRAQSVVFTVTVNFVLN